MNGSTSETTALPHMPSPTDQTCGSMRFFHVRLLLRIKRPVSLHAYHAPALYALLAAANGEARNCPPSVPDGVLLSAPEQCRIRLQRGEHYAFGLTILDHTAQAAGRRLDQVIAGLRRIGRTAASRAPALGGNFEVALVEDLVARGPHAEGKPLCPVSLDQIAAEIIAAKSLPRWTLHFTSPFRCQRPRSVRADGHGYFDRTFFDARTFVGRLASRLRSLGLLPADRPFDFPPPLVASNQLVWIDASYGPREHRKALGGAVGRVTLTGCAPEVAELLVLGQHGRLGSQTRFGFGAYRIAELGPWPFACARAASLLELAASSSFVDAAAEELDLESGVLVQSLAEIQSGAYRPDPHTRLSIQRADGGERVLAVPSRRDRALQRIVLDQIAPGVDLFLEDSSTAFRRGLGRQRAATRIREAYRRGYRWAVKADFAAFFDSVDHRELFARVDAYLADEQLAALVATWVRAGAPASDRGLPTGAPLSPLLANLLLDQFDEQVAGQGGFLVRYADDFLILFRRFDEAEHIFQIAAQAADALKLQLNAAKTELLELSQPFDFLGFHFQRREAWECAGGGKPAEIDDLGWCESAGPRSFEVAASRLPGESSLTPRSVQSTVIWGPNVASLRTQGGKLLCDFTDPRPPQSIPLDSVRELFVLGSPSIDAHALRAVSAVGIQVFLADEAGRPIGTITPDSLLEDAPSIAAQAAVAQNPLWRLEIARALVSAKLRNYAALSDAYRGRDDDRTTGRVLAGLAENAQQAASVEQLLGIEGAGAARWYGQFSRRLPPHFHFDGRVAPAAEDPINILLNIAQTVLYRHLVILIRQVGLAPSVGILHQPRTGHAALASDLQEPFRHLMDRAVIETAPRLRLADFVPSANPRYPTRVLPRAARELLAQIHRLLVVSVHAKNTSEPRPYRLQMLGLARTLRTHLCDRSHPFRAFEHP